MDPYSCIAYRDTCNEAFTWKGFLILFQPQLFYFISSSVSITGLSRVRIASIFCGHVFKRAISFLCKGRRGRMVVGFTTTHVI